MPDRLTTPEGVDKLTDEIAAKLAKLRMSTDKAPNGVAVRSWYDRYGSTINVVLGVALAATIAAVGTIYRTSLDKLEAVEKTSNRAERMIEEVQRDRTARIADLDQWRSKTEDELRTYRVGYSDFRRSEGVIAELGKKLGDGRDERLRDRETDRKDAQQSRDAIIEAISDLKQQVALLRQSMEARGRRSEDNPFGGNQRWNGLPFLGLPATRSILREIFLPLPSAAQILRVADRSPTP